MTESHPPVAGHDAWFRAKVQEALDDPRPAIPHEQVEAHFAKRRAAANERRDRNGYSKQPQALTESRLWEAAAVWPAEKPE
jgi:hypothetical protein